VVLEGKGEGGEDGIRGEEEWLRGWGVEGGGREEGRVWE